MNPVTPLYVSIAATVASILLILIVLAVFGIIPGGYLPRLNL